jgi:mono/diheme cytochrome c family protein
MSQDGTSFVRAPPEEEGYSSMHIALLHAFKTHSVLTEDDIKSVIAYIMTSHS